VFGKLLDAEVQASRNPEADPTRIVPENYDFKLLGTQELNGRECYLVELKAKKKAKYLLNGKMWVDREDYAVVRLEGRPSANITFWVGKPYIEQNFAKYGGYWLASSNHSVSDSRLLGRTDLTIHYRNYEVNGTGVENIAMDKRPARAKHAGTLD